MKNGFKVIDTRNILKPIHEGGETEEYGAPIEAIRSVNEISLAVMTRLSSSTLRDKVQSSWCVITELLLVYSPRWGRHEPESYLHGRSFESDTFLGPKEQRFSY